MLMMTELFLDCSKLCPFFFPFFILAYVRMLKKIDFGGKIRNIIFANLEHSFFSFAQEQE